MRRKLLIGAAIVPALIGLTALTAGAQDIDPAQAVTDLGTQVNLLWVVIGAVLVIFMQAGFALVETGFCRAKHAAHVVSTNFAIFGLGLRRLLPRRLRAHVRRLLACRSSASTRAVGEQPHRLGRLGLPLEGRLRARRHRQGPAAPARRLGFFLYMVAFMDTAATIPTGAMAERWKWKSFVGWGLFCGAIYYPLFGAWTWGGGWLAKLGNTMDLGVGYVDFAGSGVVHAVGGVAALAGALVLGPRIGKFDKDGTPSTLPGHHIPMAMLGTSSCCSAGSASTPPRRSRRPTSTSPSWRTNTAIAGAFGAVIGDVLDHVRGPASPIPG